MKQFLLLTLFIPVLHASGSQSLQCFSCAAVGTVCPRCTKLTCRQGVNVRCYKRIQSFLGKPEITAGCMTKTRCQYLKEICRATKKNIPAVFDCYVTCCLGSFCNRRISISKTQVTTSLATTPALACYHCIAVRTSCRSAVKCGTSCRTGKCRRPYQCVALGTKLEKFRWNVIHKCF